MLQRRRLLILPVVALAILSSGVVATRAQRAATTAPYYPPRLDWARQSPAGAGFDPAKLKAAVDFAIENENPATKDLAVDVPNTFRREAPYNALIGPTSPRAGANGLARLTWPGSATCSSGTASGPIANSYRRSGSDWREHPA